MGKPMQIGTLLPEEIAELQKHGWREGDPIPENMAEYVDAKAVAPGSLQSSAQELAYREQREATDPQFMPPPGPLDTPVLDFSEKDITELSPEEAARANQVAASVIQAARDAKLLDDEMPAEADASVRDAVRIASAGPELQDDTQSDNYATGMPKEQSEAFAAPDTTPCSRCGWPKHLSDPVEPTEDDKLVFVQAMLGQKQFTKSYKLFGDRIAIHIRSIMPHEADAIWSQIAADYDAGRIKTAIDERDYGHRYRACLQVIGIEGLDRHVTLPQSYRAWVETLPAESAAEPIRAIYDTLQEKLAVSESIHRTLTNTVAEFNQLQFKMEANSQNPDFWKATDAS